MHTSLPGSRSRLACWPWQHWIWKCWWRCVHHSWPQSTFQQLPSVDRREGEEGWALLEGLILRRPHRLWGLQHTVLLPKLTALQGSRQATQPWGQAWPWGVSGLEYILIQRGHVWHWDYLDPVRQWKSCSDLIGDQVHYNLCSTATLMTNLHESMQDRAL